MPQVKLKSMIARKPSSKGLVLLCCHLMGAWRRIGYEGMTFPMLTWLAAGALSLRPSALLMKTILKALQERPAGLCLAYCHKIDQPVLMTKGGGRPFLRPNLRTYFLNGYADDNEDLIKKVAAASRAIVLKKVFSYDYKTGEWSAPAEGSPESVMLKEFKETHLKEKYYLA